MLSLRAELEASDAPIRGSKLATNRSTAGKTGHVNAQFGAADLARLGRRAGETGNSNRSTGPPPGSPVESP